MTIKEVVKLIGKKNLKQFNAWIQNQTVSCYPNGETDYYDWDVDEFVKILKGKSDRQKGMFWD